MTPIEVRSRDSRVVRFIWKFSFHVCRVALHLLSYLNHRAYMVGYSGVLKIWGMKINGTPRYIAPDCYFDNLRLITLGDRVVLSTNVQFLTHDYSITTALIAVNRMPQTDIASERAIRVGDNVFIGRNTLVMPGTEIGSNVIVGAGSVVRGSVPENSIVIGNPAAKIGDLTIHAEALLADRSKWSSLRAD